MVNLYSWQTKAYLLHMKICMMITGTMTYLQSFINELIILRILIGIRNIYLWVKKGWGYINRKRRKNQIKKSLKGLREMAGSLSMCQPLILYLTQNSGPWVSKERTKPGILIPSHDSAPGWTCKFKILGNISCGEDNYVISSRGSVTASCTLCYCANMQ